MKNNAGFTFIELMFVIVIIGILAAIAYPLYTDHIDKTRRMDAKTGLLELRQWLESNYAITNDYSKDPAIA